MIIKLIKKYPNNMFIFYMLCVIEIQRYYKCDKIMLKIYLKFQKINKIYY